MNAPDLFALHEAIKHFAYEQAQLHPLESSTWMQAPYWLEGMAWMTLGVVVGWWCHRLLRGELAGPRMHEHLGKRFERHASGTWLQHIHDPETAKLSRLEVCEDEPPGVNRAVTLNSPNQRLKSAR